VLEGLEVAIIVATFGAAARAFLSAALAAAAALVVIGGAGAMARRLVERIPRSVLQLLVGTLLSAFGCFWAVEGLGIAWPGGALFIIGHDWTVAAAVAAALVVTWLLHTGGVDAWWLPPLVAVAATGASLRRIKG